MTEKPELKNWITTGNFLTIAITLATMGGVYARMDARLSVMEVGHNDQEQRLRGKEQSDYSTSKEVALELAKMNTNFVVELAKMNARLTEIEKAVKP